MAVTTVSEPVRETCYQLKQEIRALGLTVPNDEDPGGDPLDLGVEIGFSRRPNKEFAVPRVTLDPGPENWDRFEPDKIEYEEDPDDSSQFIVTYRTAIVRFSIQLDLWTNSVTDRYRLKPKLSDLFGSSIDSDGNTTGADLELTLAAVYDADASVQWPPDGAQENDQDHAEDGIHRYRVPLSAQADKLKQTTVSKQTVNTDDDVSEGASVPFD